MALLLRNKARTMIVKTIKYSSSCDLLPVAVVKEDPSRCNANFASFVLFLSLLLIINLQVFVTKCQQCWSWCTKKQHVKKRFEGYAGFGALTTNVLNLLGSVFLPAVDRQIGRSVSY